MAEAALKLGLASALVFEWLAYEEVKVQGGGTTRGGGGAWEQSGRALKLWRWQMADGRWQMQMADADA